MSALRKIETVIALIFLSLSFGTSYADVRAEFVPDAVVLLPKGHGWILTNQQGMTLYTFTDDQIGGEPRCVADCAETWPPLLMLADTALQGDWSLVQRSEGTHQLTFRGKPLHSYIRDESRGDMNGDELLQKWYVAIKPIPLPPGFGTYKTPDGHLLVDQKNMSLYVSGLDQSGITSCDDACAKVWAPVEAWWAAKTNVADWSIIERQDGTNQWAFRDQPLYRYAGDFMPGEISGDGIEERRAVILEPSPPIPDWVTFRKSDGGELMADASGKTLYTYDLPKQRAFGIGIGRDMATPHLWTPVYADSDTSPVGHWSTVALDDGRHQWAYKGLKIYVHERDTTPGSLNGQRSSDRYWRTIMTDGKVMAGSGR